MCSFRQADLYLNMKKNFGGSQKLFGQLRLSLVNHNGVAHLSHLSLPKDKIRMHRDDITIQVVVFDEEYLRKF